MQGTQSNNNNICLICCEQNQIFILPKCNHKQMCWKCCMKLIKIGKFQCPFCRDSNHQKQKIIFVTLQQMNKYQYCDLCQIKYSPISLLKSEKNQNFYYSNTEIAQKIQYQTSYSCCQCQQQQSIQFKSLNQLKKHLDLKHHKQYCDICLQNRKCIQSQQFLYTDNQYQKHLTSGEFTQNGDLILYHPKCDFCKQYFYDIDQFKRHLEKQHQKCFLCFRNIQQLKYVYFKDYQQAILHFKKSHFYCQIANCMNTKFQNVFITQEALNDHIQRIHKKSKKNNQPVLNIQLGFNKNQNHEIFQWDKIGKNYMQIFQMVQKHANVSKLQPVQHYDTYIDIRDFYPQQYKRTINLSLQKIKQIIQNKIDDIGYRNQQIYVSDIQFFKPLDMTPLTRIQLQKFLNAVFQPKIATPIINNFFQGRQDFKSSTQYFSFVKSKMCSYHKIAYYYSFPQLIRFFKNQNPHKILMEQYYYESLRQLKVKKLFIIHSKSKYSQILQYMKKCIQLQIQQRFNNHLLRNKNNKKEILILDIQKYQTFLKDLNSTYYIQNQIQIFYVSKDKMINLYHMINRCKVKDLLKMNWLLKIGFNNQAYHIIQKDFYYKIEEQAIWAMKKLTIQQLAYLYAYLNVSLQGIFQQILFKNHKEKTYPFFLSNIMRNFKNISNNDKFKEIFRKIVQKENQSLQIEYHVKQNINKGIIINDKQYQSLLDYSKKNQPKKEIKKIQKNQDFPNLVAFGSAQRPKIWNQNINSIQINKINVEQYPSILTPKKQDKKSDKKQQQDFPVFHYVGKKNKNKNNVLINNNDLNSAIGWANKAFIPQKWNEEESKKNRQKILQEQERKIKKKKQFQQNQKIQEQKFAQNKLSQNIINKKVNIQHPKPILTKTQIKIEPIKQVKQTIQPMIISKGKKSNLIDENIIFQQTKKKNKKNKQSKIQKQQDQDLGLFEKIEKQQNQKNKKNNISLNNELNGQKQQQNISKNGKKNYVKYEQPKYIVQNNQFPTLGGGKKQNKNNSNIMNKTFNQTNSYNKPLEKVEDKITKKKKHMKTRLDDTSSQDQIPAKKQQKKPIIKIQEKSNKPQKQEQFASISEQFKKNQQNQNQVISKVNKIIKQAKVQDQPQNLIKIKKGRNGKKVIVQHVNFFAL